MKKALGIVLLVLAISLVSVPALAQTAELSLKYWHAGVGGADLWVGDYGEYEYEYPGDSNGVAYTGYGVHQLSYPAGDVFSAEKLVLQPGTGRSFILSGSYFLYPTISIGISYWGLNRANTEGTEFIAKEWIGEEVYGGDTYHVFENSYLLRVPWWDKDFSFTSYAREYWEGESLEYRESYGEAFLTGEGSLSMSALDISGTKALAGPGWEVALSGGIRRATFDQNQSTELKYYGYKYEYPGSDYYESGEWTFDLDSRLSFSAVGPQVGIEGDYALGDKLVLKAGAKAGFLFGTAASDAQWRIEHTWQDVYFEDNIKVVETDLDSWSIEMPHLATDPVQINTYDLSASLGYRITEQWSVEAGYYVSLWKGVPSLYLVKCNDSDYEDDLDDHLYEYYYYDDEPDHELWAWEQSEARDIIVRGLTLGVNFKF